MITHADGSVIRSVEAESSLPDLYIVSNDALEGLLLNRNLTGVLFRTACLEASRMFIRHLEDEIRSKDVCELVILSKGLIYQLATAVALELNRNLPSNLVATTRQSVVADDVKIELSYTRFDAGGSTLLIGDTVASGATVVAALESYRLEHHLERVLLVSYAGATVGARRISEYCRSVGMDCTILFGLAAFGLGNNGFDLSFTHPETITDPIYRQRSIELFGDKQVSAVGWDFGSQAMAPTKYQELTWLEAERHGLHGSESLAVEKRPHHADNLSYESAAFADIDWPGKED